MILAAAFVPATPLLVPEVAAGAADELDELRAACRTAIKRVTAQTEQVVLVGAGTQTRSYGATARGTLAGFGVPLEVPLGSDEPGPVELPPSLTVGAWLVRDALGPDTGAVAFAVASADDVLPRYDASVALIVIGDGSARRTTSAPGYLDPHAADFDARVAETLGAGQGAMLRVDPRLGAELLAAGTGAWNAVASDLETGPWDAELLYDDAPYGVGYFVAAWTLRA